MAGNNYPPKVLENLVSAILESDPASAGDTVTLSSEVFGSAEVVLPGG